MAARTWKLITYNIHKGIPPFRNLSAIDRVRASLIESEADFLLLQEVVGERHRRYRSTKVERHLESLADARWPYHAYGKNAVFPKRNHGNAVLSAEPIRQFHNKDLTVYPLEKRGLLHCELDRKLKGLHLASVHLDLTGITRGRQLLELTHYLKRNVPKTAPLILAGDFNDWQRKGGEMLKAELGLRELSAPSFPALLPLLHLDRIYTRGVKVVRFGALGEFPWNRLSDHLPLCLEFQLKA